MKRHHSDISGQSMLELLVGVAVAIVFFTGVTAAIAPALEISKQTTIVQTKTELGVELMDNVEAWAGSNWNNILGLATGTTNAYYLNTTSSPFFAVSGTGEQVTVGNAVFSRYFYVSDVYRDANGNVTTTASGNYDDPSTKFVTVAVKSSSTAAIPIFTFGEYLTRNENDDFNQTDWSVGSGQNMPVTVVGGSFASSTGITISASGSIQLSAGSASCVI